MSTVCWLVIATVEGSIAINKIVFSNVINKKKNIFYSEDIFDS